MQRRMLYCYQFNKTKRQPKCYLKYKKLWFFFFLLLFCLVSLGLFVLKGKQKTLCKIIPLALGRETVQQELTQGSADSWKS